MMRTTGLYFALTCSLLTGLAGLGSLACKGEPKRVDPIQSDKSASAAPSPSASSVVVPPPKIDVGALAGDFDRFDDTGATFTVLVPSSDSPKSVWVIDAKTFATKTKRDLDPTVVAYTYGGAIQVVNDGKSLTRVVVDGAKKTPIPTTLIDVAALGGDDASISDDGRLFTFGSLDVFDLDTLAIAYSFAIPCAGGPNPTATVDPKGHYATGVCRGTFRSKLGKARGPELPWEESLGRFVVSADERVVLEGAYMPFAMDWVPEFSVIDEVGKTPRVTVRKLVPKAGEAVGPDYQMALSPKGDVAAVLVDGTLELYRTSDGKVLLSKKGPKVEGTRLAFHPTEAALWIASEKKLQIERIPTFAVVPSVTTSASASASAAPAPKPLPHPLHEGDVDPKTGAVIGK